jgi:hypothetical protein
LLDHVFSFLPELGVVDRLGDVPGTAVQRERVPCVQSLLLSSLQTRFGIEGMHALPALVCSEVALMRLVGFTAQQVRHGVCQRGAAPRQGPRRTGPSCPDALADHLVTRNGRDLEAWFNGAIRALAKAGVCAAKVPGIVAATDLETTAQYTGGGHATRKRKVTDTRGKVHESEVTVYGWQLIVLMEARTKIPVAAQVVPIPEPATLSLRALVTPARTHLASHVGLHNVVFDRGFWDGTDRGWLAQHGRRLVVPAKDHRAVTVDARAQAAAGAGMTSGRRVHTVRHGQGSTAGSERLETEVVGRTGLTTDDQYGTSAHRRHHNRRAFQPHLINAVVVRTWHGREYGPGGKPVFLTNAAVDKPLQPCAAADDRRLMEHCCRNESQPPWSLKHPPQKTARAVGVHGILTLLLVALATAYRLPCEPDDMGQEPVGWQRWRRQLWEQTREQVIVFAQGCDGRFQMAEYSRLVGVTIKDRPPGIGTRQPILAKHGITAHG